MGSCKKKISYKKIFSEDHYSPMKGLHFRDLQGQIRKQEYQKHTRHTKDTLKRETCVVTLKNIELTPKIYKYTLARLVRTCLKQNGV